MVNERLTGEPLFSLREVGMTMAGKPSETPLPAPKALASTMKLKPCASWKLQLAMTYPVKFVAFETSLSVSAQTGLTVGAAAV